MSNWAVFESKLSLSLFYLYFVLLSHSLWHVPNRSTWQKITLLCSTETTHGRSSLCLLLSPSGEKNKNKTAQQLTHHFEISIRESPAPAPRHFCSFGHHFYHTFGCNKYSRAKKKAFECTDCAYQCTTSLTNSNGCTHAETHILEYHIQM